MQPVSFFAYGTLKLRQVRAHCWPFKPTSVQIAFTRGKLFDLGPYPALAEGENWVQGELWTFLPSQISKTLKVIDDVEGYEQSPDDLYDRRIISCVLENGEIESAFCYFFLRWKSVKAKPVEPIHPLPNAFVKAIQNSERPLMEADRLFAVWEK